MWSEGCLDALVLIISGIVFIFLLSGRKERFPPGPFGWPILGHAHLLNNLPHQALRDMSSLYGPMIGLRLGQRKVVVVSSPELAKEVLLTHDKVYANRPPFQFTTNLFYKNEIAFSLYNSHLTKQRKVCTLELFTTKRLQELEHVRKEELGLLLHRIHEDACGGMRAVNLGTCVGSMSSHIVMRLLQSKAIDEVVGENLHELVTAIEQQTLPTLGDLIPWLSCFDFFRLRHMRNIHARADKVLSAILTERKQSASCHDDLLHALLSKEVDVNMASSQQDTLTLHDIKGILMDMIVAGIGTTAITLEWAMAELLRNPNCIHRLRQEIDMMVGKKQQLTDADIAKLSYLKCIVKEVFRLHPAAPLLIPRISTKECKIQGYILPKNTIMLVNVWAIGRDDKVWDHANEFMPERFEGKKIDVKGQHFELLPFGSGRRVCLGMALGLSIVEVTLANLVNTYDWELPDGLSSINMNEKKGGLGNNRASPVIAIPKPRV